MSTTYTPSSVLATLIQDMETDLRLQNARTLDALSAKGCVVSTDMVEMNWNVVVADSGVVGVPMTSAGAYGATTVATGATNTFSSTGVASTNSTATGVTAKARLTIGDNKFYHQFDVYRTDLKDAAARGTQALRRLFGFHINAGVLALRKAVNTAIWLGDGTSTYAGVVGMGTVVGSNSTPATYAEINPTTWTNWKPIVDWKTGTARALTRTLLNNLDTQRDIEESYYDTIVCHPRVLQTYSELFEVSPITAFMNLKEDRDLAPGTRMYNGVPIVSDSSCPTDRLVFFNSQAVKLVSMDLSDSDRGVVAGYGMKDNFSSISVADVGGLKVNVALLPQVNPGVMSFQLFVVPQLKVENRRQVSAILNIAPAAL